MSPTQVQLEVYRVSSQSVRPKNWWALGFWSQTRLRLSLLLRGTAWPQYSNPYYWKWMCIWFGYSFIWVAYL